MISTYTIHDVARKLFLTVTQAREHLDQKCVSPLRDGTYLREAIERVVLEGPAEAPPDSEFYQRLNITYPGKGSLTGPVTLRQIAVRFGYEDCAMHAQVIRGRLRRAFIVPVIDGSRGKPAYYSGDHIERWWKMLSPSRRKAPDHKKSTTDRSIDAIETALVRANARLAKIETGASREADEARREIQRLRLSLSVLRKPARTA